MQFIVEEFVLISRWLRQMNMPEKLPENMPVRGNGFSLFLGAFALKMMGWRMEGEFPNEKKMIIAVAPHTSNWDFVVAVSFMFCVRLRTSFMAKNALFIAPFKGIMRWLGGIPINRSRAHGVVAQMVDKFNQEDSLALALAPEGTRRLTPRWKTGFLQIAAKANVPVLLIGLDYKRKTFVVGPCENVSDDTDAELKKALAFFDSVTGKYPENCDTTGQELERKVEK